MALTTVLRTNVLHCDINLRGSAAKQDRIHFRYVCWLGRWKVL